MTPTERKRNYRHRVALKLTSWRSGPCEVCRSDKRCEMAHVAPTPLGGRSRGQSRRYHDLRKHPLSYARLCAVCHGKVDFGWPAHSRGDLKLGTPEWAL